MPQVFTGQVAIPGDQVEAYLAALAEAEEARRPFRQHLEGLRAEFEQHLAAQYTLGHDLRYACGQLHRPKVSSAVKSNNGAQCPIRAEPACIHRPTTLPICVPQALAGRETRIVSGVVRRVVTIREWWHSGRERLQGGRRR